MGLAFANLDGETRKWMIEEIAFDAKADTLYRSPWLTQGGQGDWEELLRDAAANGNDDTLAAQLRLSGRIAHTAQRRKPKTYGYTTYRVPVTAPEIMACEFNRFYVRGLCRRAIAEGVPRLEVYRAKAVDQPRPGSPGKVGLLVDPEVILVDLRNTPGVEPTFGIPSGPNSGLCLRIPI